MTQVFETLETLDWGDYKTMFAETMFEVLAGVAISPLVGAIYMIGPLLLVSITTFLRRSKNNTWRVIGTIVSLLLSILIYESIKISTLPGYETFVPFSPWIRDISYSTGLILQKIVPVILFVIAALIAWFFTYRKSANSALNFIMIYLIKSHFVSTIAIFASASASFFLLVESVGEC